MKPSDVVKAKKLMQKREDVASFAAILGGLKADECVDVETSDNYHSGLIELSHEDEACRVLISHCHKQIAAIEDALKALGVEVDDDAITTAENTIYPKYEEDDDDEETDEAA